MVSALDGEGFGDPALGEGGYEVVSDAEGVERGGHGLSLSSCHVGGPTSGPSHDDEHVRRDEDDPRVRRSKWGALLAGQGYQR